MKKLSFLLHKIIVFLQNLQEAASDKTVTFTPRNVVNLFIVYILDACSQDVNTDFTLKDCYFGTVKLSKHVYPDKSSYSGCSIAFDSLSLLSYPGFDLEKRLLFLEQTIIHQYILIIIKRSPRSW